MSSQKPFIGAFVNQDTIDRVDQFRGQYLPNGRIVSRSRIIENALIQFLKIRTTQAQGERVNKKK